MWHDLGGAGAETYCQLAVNAHGTWKKQPIGIIERHPWRVQSSAVLRHPPKIVIHTKCTSASRSQTPFMYTDHIRSHLSIPGRVSLRRQPGARARLEHVLDGGSLRGGLCPGSHCCDWGPTCRLQRTQCLFDPRHPPPCSTISSAHFCLLPHPLFQIIKSSPSNDEKSSFFFHFLLFINLFILKLQFSSVNLTIIKLYFMGFLQLLIPLYHSPLTYQVSDLGRHVLSPHLTQFFFFSPWLPFH